MLFTPVFGAARSARFAAVAFFRMAVFPRRFGLPHRRPPPLRRRDDPRAALGAEAALPSWRPSPALASVPLQPWPPGQPPAVPLRGSYAPARGGEYDALGRFVAATATVLSKPGGPVMRTRTPPRDGSAAIQASNGCARRCPAASTAASMRSRRIADIPLESKTVSGIEVRSPCQQRRRPVNPIVRDGVPFLGALRGNGTTGVCQGPIPRRLQRLNSKNLGHALHFNHIDSYHTAPRTVSIESREDDSQVPMPLVKSINLSIDQHSWANAPGLYQHPIPPQFVSPAPTTTFDFLRALTWVGMMAVPPNITGWFLAIRWAELRYLGAADHRFTALRLDPAVADLETHYLASLSDDWGVGIALEWITSNFDIASVGHGRFWCDYLVKKEKTATYRRPPGKRGPAKCPDIVAHDSAGLMYLIECKGTTTNSDYTTDQFKKAAFDQKISVEFDDESKVAQRLASGVFVARHDSSEGSRLRIADPPPEGRERKTACFVEATPLQMARALKADTISRGLLAAGFIPEALSLMPEASDRSWNPQVERYATFRLHDIEWQGRVERFDLPIPIRIEDREYRAATVRDGISTRFLRRMRQLPTSDRDNDALLDAAGIRLHPLHERDTARRAEGLYGGVRHGDVAIRDITLSSE